MAIEKVDIDNQGWTYSSYTKAGDFVFTSICSGFGATIEKATATALDQLQRYLHHAGVTLDDLVKVFVPATSCILGTPSP